MTEPTGSALGFVAACPDLEVLELTPLSPRIHDHIEVCEACQLALELLAASDPVDACERYEPLIAARADGSLGRAPTHLLDRHLASCPECRELVEATPPSEERDLETLPLVATESYALGAEVGRGGMGRILAARDLRVGRPVAIKELRPDRRNRSRQVAARFEREARITARLQHPGIVPIYEIGRWADGTPFYSMRFVDGRTLREAIGAAGTLAERLVLLPAVIAAIEAVAFAHSQHIIHRDLTPSNILVGAFGETVVIDWGIAKDLSAPDVDDTGEPEPRNDELTDAGVVIGTAAYMPPEQANALTVDERTDVYALGALLYHLLAGTPPYRGDGLIEAVKAGPPRAIASVAPSAPRDLLSIVTKAMDRDPAKRYVSAQGLAEELKRFQAGRIVEAHVYTTVERMRRFVARNRAPLAVTAIAALVLGVLGVVAVRRVLRERTSSERMVVALLEEEGRSELLDGDSQRAAAYLEAATAKGAEPSRALEFMRAAALREVANVVDDLECGGAVNDLSSSRDGQWLVASCHDRARMWRLSDRSDVRTFEPCTAGCDHHELAHVHPQLVTYGADGVARLWDIDTGALVRSFRHGEKITFATLTPDDKLLATTGYDGWARIWDVETGKLVREFRGSDSVLLPHLYGVLSKDGARLLTFTIEGIGAGFEIATGNKIGQVEHGGMAVGGAVSPNGDLACTCGTNRLVKLWDTSSPLLRGTLAGATDTVIACKFSDDGKRVLGTSEDGHAYVWEVATSAMVSSVNHGTNVWTGHFSHNGRQFVTVGLGWSVKVWDTETGGLLTTHDSFGGHEAVFSPDGSLLIAGRGDGRIRIWSDPTGPLLATYDKASKDIADYTNNGELIVENTPAGLVVRDITSDATRALDPSLIAPIAAATTRLALATRDGQVAIVDARTGVRERTLAVGGKPHVLGFFGRGSLLVVELEQGSPEVWDLATGTKLCTLAGARHAIVDGRGVLAVGWQDGGTPQIWDLASSKQLGVLATTGTPIAIAGDFVVVDDHQGAARVATIWSTTGNVETTTEVAATPALDPTGRYLTIVGVDHTISVRDLVEGGDVSFASEALQTAQADPSGELVAGVDQRGTSVTVFASRDGRVLARWPLAHDATAPFQDSLIYPYATARWSADGSTIVSNTRRQLACWDASTSVPAHAAELVRAKVAWRVAGAALVRAKTSFMAVITHRGAPLANTPIKLVFRKPADLVGSSSGWDAATFNYKALALTTDADGRVARDNLTPGSYEIQVGDATRLVDIDVDDGERTISVP